MDWTQVCRACMKKFTLRGRKFSNSKTMKMFYFCINKKFPDRDNLPKQFCIDCFNKIQTSFSFLKRARKVELKLGKLLNHYQTSADLVPKHEPEFGNTLEEFTETIEENEVKIETELKQELLSNEDNNCISKTSVIDNLNEIIKNLPAGITLKSKKSSENTNKDFKPKPKFKDYADGTKLDIKLETISLSSDDENQYLDEVGAADITLNDFTDSDTEGDSEKGDKKGNKNKILEDKHAKALAKTRYPCTKCKKSYLSKLCLAKHMRKEHARINECPRCERTFARQSTLKNHVKKNVCTKVSYTCKECGRVFDQRKCLNGHMSKHLESRPLRCELCPKRFIKQAALNYHMKLHKAGRVGQKFLCSVCGTSLTTKGALNTHMRIHTGERPFSCRECSKAFNTASARVKHERSHRREYFFSCDVCPKRFTEQGSLTRHLRTHTGELPYKCSFCGSGFIDRWKRKAHMMRAHNLALHEIPRLKGGRPRAQFVDIVEEPDGTAAVPQNPDENDMGINN